MKSIIFAILLLIPSVAEAATYYIDQTTGNNSDSGLTEALAWKTTAAITGTTFSFDPGDQILFKRGETWAGENWRFDSSGTAESPIIFDAYGTGAIPNVGAMRTHFATGARRHDLIFRNLKFDAQGVAQFAVTLNTSYNVLMDTVYVDGANLQRDCLVINGNAATTEWAEDIEIKNSTVTNCGETGTDTEPGVGLQIRAYARDVVAHHNTFSDCEEVCMQSGTTTAEEIAGSSYNIHFYDNNISSTHWTGNGCTNAGWGTYNFLAERNICTNTQYGFSTDSYSGTVVYQNNIVIDAVLGFSAVTNTALGAVGNGGSIDSLSILNNTIIDAGHLASGVSLGGHEGPSAAVIKNNVMTTLSQWDHLINLHDTTAWTSVISDNNLFYSALNATCANQFEIADVEKSFSQWKTLTSGDANSQCANPTLSTLTVGYPLPGSPAINAGTTISTVTDDYRGKARPFGAAYDVGAYEYRTGIEFNGVNLN